MIDVYMDDFRSLPQGFTSARTTEECLMLLQNGPLSPEKLREIAAGGESK